MHLNISKSERSDIKMTKNHPEASMVVIDAEVRDAHAGMVPEAEPVCWGNQPGSRPKQGSQ